MTYHELAKWAQNRTNFHMQKRIHVYQLTRLLALSSEGTNHQAWNCMIAPQREISHLIRSQSTARTDCNGEFSALLLTRPKQRTPDKSLKVLCETMQFEASEDSSDSLSAWIMKLIYIARGMNLLVKPIFRFDAQALQTAMNIPKEQKIIAVLLVGYPEEMEPNASCPKNIRFHTKSIQHNL